MQILPPEIINYLSSPLGLTIFLALIILAVVFRRPIAALLSKEVPNPNYDPIAFARSYVPRAQRRMEQVAVEVERLDRLVRQGRLDERSLTEACTRLRQLANAQRDEIIPAPFLEEHKQAYFRLMDIQARKAEDFLATGGKNLGTLQAEEEELGHQAYRSMNEADRKAHELANELGVAPPGFSQPNLLSQRSDRPEVEEVRLALLGLLHKADEQSGSSNDDSWNRTSRRREEQRQQLEREYQQQRQLREQREQREREHQERHHRMLEYERQLYGASNRPEDHEK